jgi:RNA polymerase sigma-70 factor (ECF subfamily)
MTTDWELLSAWRAGDASAGDALVATHFGAVSRFFRGKLGDDVDDLIQQTFLACVERRGEITGGSFKSYLFGVARNRLMDHLRARARSGVAVDFAVSSLLDLGTSPSQTLAREQGAELLMRALATLPVDMQIALELTYWEGLSGRDVADVLGVAEPTVRSRLTRARDQLLAALAELGVSDPNALFPGRR